MTEPSPPPSDVLTRISKTGVTRLKTGASKLSRVPQGTTELVVESSRVVYGHTSRTVKDLKEADLRFHRRPIELTQAITVSAQARLGDTAETATTQIGKATTTAATKVGDLTGTAATEIGKATTTAATKVGDLTGTAATEIGKATTTAATKVGDLTGTAATEIGKATTTAATKVGDLTGTAATEIGKAIGISAARLAEHSRAFHQSCRESFKSLDDRPRNLGEDADAWAQAAAAGAWGAFLTLQKAVPSFSDLPPAMKAKFAAAGMHGAWRPVDAAGAFYESSIPFTVRNLGEDAVLAFVDGKHAGHIEAVANAPGRMADAANIVWERARDNLARGAADMTPLELAKANALNALHATGIVMTEALQTAAVAGCIGMALEGVVSVTENLIYVYKDEMTLQQGGRRVLKDMLKKGKAAAIGGAGMTVVVALGAGPALATAAPVLVTVGGVLYVVSAYSRIKTALDSAEQQPELLPLDPAPPALGTA